MDIENYLKNQSDINLSGLAKRMWPNNKYADNYLSKKLNGLDGRKWTKKDTERAKIALQELGIFLQQLS
ncbi:hypothetical protein [Dyadobacter sp. 3J3]|uniref:hypothetical protein n=1 Tax=Dyadobacter sp. 3J3 TaxID=2606600 RepID=UPI00135C14DB|nr:hypothetical protein [Dyadobacter sp. 3J3]